MCLGSNLPNLPDRSCAGKNVVRSLTTVVTVKPLTLDRGQQCCQLIIYSESFSEKILSIVVTGNINVSDTHTPV